MRFNRISVLIFCNHIGLIASISRVGKTGTQDTVSTHILNCLYSELVTSVSSIQNPSTKYLSLEFLCPRDYPASQYPSSRIPGQFWSFHKGMGSANAFPLTPTTSPPLPARRHRLTADIPSVLAKVMIQRNNMSFSFSYLYNILTLLCFLFPFSLDSNPSDSQ